MDWVPLAVPLVLILVRAAERAAAKPGWTKLIGNPSIALPIGALLCLALAQNFIQEIIRTASRRSSVIMLDLCGVGAFGYVISQSGLGQALYSALGHVLQAIALPLPALFNSSTGSRV